MPSTISLFRPALYWGCARNLKVKIDGVEVEPVKNNSTQVYEVAAGEHTLQITMDWCSSAPLTLTLAEGETTYLKGEVPNIFTLSGFGALFVGPFFWPKTLFKLTVTEPPYYSAEALKTG